MFFLKSVGLSIHENDLIISKVSQKLFNCAFESMVIKDFLLKDSLDLKLMIDAQGYDKQDIVLSWPREKTIVREVELPASSINELKESISYQLDSFILFTEEDVYYDIYASLSPEYGEKAFIFAIKKEDIDDLLLKFDSLSISPSRIIISPLSFIPLVNNKTVVLDKHKDTYSYNLYMDSTLVETSLVRNLDALKEKIIESKPDTLVLPDKDFDNITDLCNDDVSVESWEKNKESMGAAINGASEYLKGFDILRASRKKQVSQMVLTSVLSVLIIAFAFIIPGITKHKKMQAIDAIERKLNELRPDVTAVSDIKFEINNILETTEKLREIAHLAHRRVDLLSEITSVLPDDTWVKQLSFKRNDFEIEGIGLSGANILALLENSLIFKDVRFASSVTKDRGGKEKFKIKGSTK